VREKTDHSAKHPSIRLAGFSVDVSLEEHVLRYEADLISRALAASDGSVTGSV